MSAEDSLREGNLPEALALLQAQVKKGASDPKLRVFLFQLLCVLGEWDRALTQLKVAGDLDPQALPMVQTYRVALRCEVLRRKVFAGELSPLVFGEPEQWLALLIEALKHTAKGEYESSLELRNQSFELAPATSGEIDGTPFEWIADADPRIGPVLEAVVNGRYYWVPFHRLTRIAVDAPADLRDAVWTPVTLGLANGGQTVALVPTRYPGSETSEDGLIRLARKTEWVEAAADLWIGRGQRMLATNESEHSLMDIRVVTLDSAPQAEAPALDTAPPADTEATGG